MVPGDTLRLGSAWGEKVYEVELFSSWSEALPAYDSAYLGLRGTFDWDQLLEFTSTVAFTPGQTVLDYAATDRALYLVTDGKLEVLMRNGHGSFDTVSTVGAGGVVGEVAFLDGGPRTAVIRALTIGEMRKLSITDFDALARVIPDLAQRVVFEVARILAARLRQADALLAKRPESQRGARITEPVQGEPRTIRKAN